MSTSSFRKETGAQSESTAHWQTHKLPFGQSRGDAQSVAVPRGTWVSGPEDPSLGGGRLGVMTPFTRSGYTP